MRRFALLVGVIVMLGAASATITVLPSGWRISAPEGTVATIGTMPQGIATSLDGTRIAVVESGYMPATLRIMRIPSLETTTVIPLHDAFGAPVWHSATGVYVAGAASNSILDVDTATQKITSIPAGHWPDAVAFNGATIATANDEDDTASIASMGTSNAKSVKAGLHPGAVLFSSDRSKLFIANRGAATLSVIASPSEESHEVAVDLHPSALALSGDGSKLYVACADADTIDVVDTATERVTDRIDVGLPQGPGASPNGLAVAQDGTIFVSLGAENAVAEIRNNRVVARVPAGWYPSGVAVDASNVYIINGKGESSHPNPDFANAKRDPSYVARLLVGSVRAIPRAEFNAHSTEQVLANVPSPEPTPPQTVVRAGGPIKHVIYIIKENRTYDQVLGDVPGANGDPKLAWFGENVTPNQHALVHRFGIFDNTYTDAQVSASGHTWSTAALANDYLERFWPPNYGGRRKLYDFEDGAIASVPRNGYLWDNAKRHGITYRNYGEFVAIPPATGFETSTLPGLKDHTDALYRGFDTTVSDEARVDEWQREFNDFVRSKSLPQLEFVRLPNDHTNYTKTGALTPRAFVAQNDHAFGRIVDIVSHSPYWKNTAIFAIEDDAQNGPDHVDDQRTTFYLVSPYAAPGVHHAHYSTTSVVRTIELLLGLPAMSIYDAVAPPMYDAFKPGAQLRPFQVMPPTIDVNERNVQTAYGASLSNHMDTRDADAVDPRIGNDILEHAAGMHNQ